MVGVAKWSGSPNGSRGTARRENQALYLRAEAFVGNFAALVLAISAAHAAGPTQAELNNAANESANWPYVDHSLAQQAYSAVLITPKSSKRPKPDTDTRTKGT
jgi:hypothetical protein